VEITALNGAVNSTGFRECALLKMSMCFIPLMRGLGKFRRRATAGLKPYKYQTEISVFNQYLDLASNGYNLPPKGQGCTAREVDLGCCVSPDSTDIGYWISSSDGETCPRNVESPVRVQPHL
jgi:hypothetical protein